MICLQYRHCAGCCFPQGRHAIACYRCRVRSSYRVIACPSSSTTCCPIRFCPSLRTVSFFCKWGPWVSQLLEYRARKFPFHHILDILAALCPPHLPLPPLASLSHILLIPPLIPPSLKFPSILVHLQTLRPRYPTTNCNYRARSTPLAPPPFCLSSSSTRPFLHRRTCIPCYHPYLVDYLQLLRERACLL